MLSSITVKAGDATHSLKLSTRAMIRVEQQFDLGVVALIQSLQGDSFRSERVTALFAAAMNDGKGADMDDAADLIDEVGGLFAAAKVIGDLAEKAFPEAVAAGQDDKATPGKNPRRTS